MNGRSPDSGSALRVRHGWLGVLLIVVFWPLNWSLPGMRTAYLFFPPVARLYPGGGCPGIYAHLNFLVDALQMGIRHAVCGLFARMVVV